MYLATAGGPAVPPRAAVRDRGLAGFLFPDLPAGSTVMGSGGSLSFGYDPAAGCSDLQGNSLPCPNVTSVDVRESITGGGSLCFLPRFPFVGNQSGAACNPMLNVGSPWDTLLTVALGGLVVAAVLRGGRR